VGAAEALAGPEHLAPAGGFLREIQQESAQMATKTENKNNSTRSRSGSTNQATGERKMFDWNEGGTGVLVGAAVAGAAVGIAANFGRKFLVQAASGSKGDWVEVLTTEHEMTLALFDKLEATDESQTGQRTALLAKIKYALSKHAIQEEMVVYPALRQANLAHEADELGSEHGYVKTYLYELENMSKDSPEFIARVRDFRALLEEHMAMEENEVFPSFRDLLSDDQNAKITASMNKEGFKFA
jgi:hemerythrin-like domain-containing protein